MKNCIYILIFCFCIALSDNALASDSDNQEVIPYERNGQLYHRRSQPSFEDAALALAEKSPLLAGTLAGAYVATQPAVIYKDSQNRSRLACSNCSCFIIAAAGVACVYFYLKNSISHIFG